MLAISSMINLKADNISDIKKSGDLTTLYFQVANYHQGIDAKLLDGKNEVLVDFMLNGKSEILILLTNTKALDGHIKGRLNYKKLTHHNLEINKKYTLPIMFNLK